MSIGNNIKKLRELRNYTQTYMSDQLEISLSAYSKIERNESEVSYRRLEQISDILRVPVHGIIQFDEKVFLDNNSNLGIKKSIQNDPLIEQMRSEIEFLRSLLHNNKSLEK